MMYIRYPLSLRQVEDILFERWIDISHETIRFWWNRFGPMLANKIRKRPVVQFTRPLGGQECDDLTTPFGKLCAITPLA